MVVMHETLIYAVYYAPRGRLRLYRLGRDIAERHLFPTDLLVGIIGAEGAGKSTLIRGVFPGLELTNDDEGINLRAAPLFDFDEADRFEAFQYLVDDVVGDSLLGHRLRQLRPGTRPRVQEPQPDLPGDAMGIRGRLNLGEVGRLLAGRPTSAGGQNTTSPVTGSMPSGTPALSGGTPIPSLVLMRCSISLATSGLLRR